jgi:Uma2 family endonuclease
MTATTTTTKLMTIAEMERLPDDDYRYTLIRGVLHRMPPPMPRHGRTTTTVIVVLGAFVRDHNLGVVYNESGFALARDPDVLVGPDVAFVRADRVPADEDSYPDLAPDLVVEVLSPSNMPALVAEKLAEYDRAGVPLVWIFDPRRRTVRVRAADGSDRVLTEGDELDGGDVLPGFRLAVARFFA